MLGLDTMMPMMVCWEHVKEAIHMKSDDDVARHKNVADNDRVIAQVETRVEK